MQLLKDPNQNNLDTLKNTRRESRRYFRNKNKEYLKYKIDQFDNDSENKNVRHLYRGFVYFKEGYQPRTNTVKDERVIWLQTPTVFWLGRGRISHNY